MAERKKVVDERILSYSGIFNGKELYQLIREYVADRGYDDHVERAHTEKKVGDSHQVEMDFMPKYKVSDYVELHMNLYITYMNMKKTTVEYKGKKHKLDEGEVRISFTGHILSDYWERWESKSHYFFIRVIMENFIFKFIYDRDVKHIKKDIDDLYNYIRQYLNTTKTE
jgi:hypothetical protein